MFSLVFLRKKKTDQLHLVTGKEPVKLVKRVKIAHAFLQSVSNEFHVIILSLNELFSPAWLA